ncbi:hypothetical protein, partial [Flavobacterium sp.]|uniref:hypothetical protein n=1 Tax=Flavobacterium sp. TaxID=239 RepID=UPI00374CA0CE
LKIYFVNKSFQRAENILEIKMQNDGDGKNNYLLKNSTLLLRINSKNKYKTKYLYDSKITFVRSFFISKI